jgi:tRNA pseudouridine38-40 synthase
MARYFIEVFYKGTNYAGFQIQQNANSIQAEVEKALKIFFKTDFILTGSSRTDAGVHALSNFFHFDTDALSAFSTENLAKAVYNLNAILPADIVIKRIFLVSKTAHCRFDAISRQYKYFIYRKKNPFYADRAYHYPYKIDLDILQAAAATIHSYKDFSSFSKRNTQVNHFICNILRSEWIIENDFLVFDVKANRFLRGMVKGLVGTMLRVGTGKLAMEDFCRLIEVKNSANTDFSVPAHGLFLVSVEY